MTAVVDEGGSPREWFGRIASWHWKKVVALALLGLLLGAGFGETRHRTYTASAELITGTYSLPTEIANQSAVSDAGPLGLELPADTQARIIASPTIVSLAVQAVGARAGDPADFAASVKAQAVTENSFSITATASSPGVAVVRANALARAYLTYRQNEGRSQLLALARQASDDAASKTKAADALDSAIAKARTNASGALQALMQRQQTIVSAADDSATRAIELTQTARSFNGGGSIPRPASARSTSGSAGLVHWALFGLLGGLVAGGLAAVIVDRFSDRLRSEADIVDAVNVPILLELPGRARWRLPKRAAAREARAFAVLEDAAVLASRAVERRRALLELAADHVVVRPVQVHRTDVTAAAALSIGYARQHQQVTLVLGHEHHARTVAMLRLDQDGHLPIHVQERTDPTTAGDRAHTMTVVLAEPVVGDDSINSLPSAVPCVIVVRRGVDTRRSVHRAADELREAGLVPVGVVVLPHHEPVHDSTDNTLPSQLGVEDDDAGHDDAGHDDAGHDDAGHDDGGHDDAEHDGADRPVRAANRPAPGAPSTPGGESTRRLAALRGGAARAGDAPKHGNLQQRWEHTLRQGGRRG